MSSSASEPTTRIAPAIARQAVEWMVELQSEGAGDATRQAWERWLHAHPDHLRAWQRIEATNGRLHTVPAPLAHAVLSAPDSPGRRRALKTLGLLAAVGGAGWIAGRRVPWQAWTADERTGPGERRTVVLPDATQVVLNTDSAIDVRFDSGRRTLRLVRGEIMVTTGHPLGDARPFGIETEHGRLRPLGTRFSVRLDDDATRVAVYSGSVEVSTREVVHPRIVLAGERTRFTASAVSPPVPADENDTAWLDGMLVVRDMPLADFVAELARYRPGHVACDPAVAGVLVSGTYPLADTDRVLAILEKSLPVAIHYRTRYWVRVVPRGA